MLRIPEKEPDGYATGAAVKRGVSRRALLRYTGLGALTAVTGVLSAGVPGPGPVRSRNSTEAAPAVVHAAIDGLFARHDLSQGPGMAVGVLRRGEVIHMRGYGQARLENPVPVTAHTVLHGASLAKQFTAFAVALLEREGALSVDDDIRSHLDFVPDLGERISIRHLIHHTSGLRDQWPLLVLGGRDLRDAIRQQHVLNLVAAQQALDFAPGTEHVYCNTGYTLLAEIIRAVSGRTLRQFATERIFEPLGMGRTLFRDDLGEVVPGRAESYRNGGDGGGWQYAPINHETVGASGLWTTAEDMLRWARNLADPVVGDEALIRRVIEPGRLRDGSPVNYGFGLYRHRLAGRDAVFHRGRDAGFTAAFAWFPKLELAVVVLANTSVDQDEIVEAIVAYCCGEDLDGAVRNPDPLSSRPSRELLENVAGHYLSDQGHMVTLRRQGDGMRLDDRVRGNEPVTFRADGTFDIGGRRRGFYRTILEDEDVAAIEEVRPDVFVPHVVRYRRVEPADPAPAELMELAGNYHSRELDVTYTLSAENGALTVRSPSSAAPVAFLPTVTDRFQTDHRFLFALTIVRDDLGKATGLRLTGSRYRDLWLERVGPGGC